MGGLPTKLAPSLLVEAVRDTLGKGAVCPKHYLVPPNSTTCQRSTCGPPTPTRHCGWATAHPPSTRHALPCPTLLRKGGRGHQATHQWWVTPPRRLVPATENSKSLAAGGEQRRCGGSTAISQMRRRGSRATPRSHATARQVTTSHFVDFFPLTRWTRLKWDKVATLKLTLKSKSLQISNSSSGSQRSSSRPVCQCSQYRKPTLCCFFLLVSNCCFFCVIICSL